MRQENTDSFGIIDIGSNTVRTVLYGDNGDVRDGFAFESHILRDTEDGILTKEGINRLLETIKESIDRIEASGDCRVCAFATSAMRDVKNFDEVYDRVYSETGVGIDLLSGEREAECDFLAIRELCANSYGTGVDLGGGSAQIIVFDENGVQKACSVPIGVKRVRNMLCGGIVPSKTEERKIEEYIKKYLSGIKGRGDTVIFMGGTAQTAKTAVKEIFGEKEPEPEFIEKLFLMTKTEPEILKRVFAYRYDTMPTGLVVMRCICRELGAQKISVTKKGVRDGYMDMMRGLL